MLIAMRNKAASIIVKVLFVLLALSFVVWGIGDVFRDGGTSVGVARVGDVEVSAQEVTREFDRQMKQLRQVLGPDFDTEQAKQLGILDRAVATIVARKLYDVYIDDLGLTVSDNEVRRMVAADPNLQTGTGSFDRARLQMLLNQLGMDEATYVASLKRDTLRKWLAGAVTTGVRVPDALADRLYRYRNETRVATTLFVADDTMPEPPAPDEATLEKYHQENAQYFQSPEYRSVVFARLKPADFAAQATISDEDLKRAYEQRSAEFDQPERRSVEQIVLADEAKAKEAEAKLAGGADFASVAQEFTGAAPIALGTVEPSGFVSDLSALSDAAFATELGKTTAPLQTPLGWHILHVTAIEPATKATFEDAREQLEKELRQQAAANAMVEAANKLDDALAGGADLSDAAATIGLEAVKVDAVDGNGNGPDGQPVVALADSPIGVALAFQTEAGETSSLTEEPGGGYIILRVEGSTPPATRPLAEVRDQVLASWTAAERAKAAEAKAAELVEKLGAGGDIAAIAGEVGVELKTSPPFKRDGAGADATVTPDLAAKLFALQVGGAAAGPTQGGQVVGRLEAIELADPANETAALEQLKTELKTQLEGDVLQQFGDRLQRSIGVETNQAAIDNLF